MNIRERIASEDSLQIVIFRIGEDYLSCPISQVREIIRLEGVTPVPSTPEMVRGIINRRGEIITILDFPKLLDSGVELADDESQLMILYSNEEEIGVLTSEVVEIPTVETKNIELPSEALESPINDKYLVGIIKHEDKLVLLTDLLSLVKNLPKHGLEKAAEFGQKEN